MDVILLVMEEASGVLINGLGPDEGHNRFVGSGYGAGGGSYSSNKLGLEGVIIVDIVN